MSHSNEEIPPKNAHPSIETTQHTDSQRKEGRCRGKKDWNLKLKRKGANIGKDAKTM